jgi:hypothetical protein
VIARRLLLLMIVAALPLMHACGGNDEESENEENGHVRLVNATQSGTLDFYQGDTRLASGVAEGGASGYALLERNTYLFKAKPAGSNTTLVESSRSAVKNTWNSLVAYTAAGTTKTTYLDDSETAPGNGTAKLRVFNASPEAGALDVYLTDANAALPQLATIAGVATEQFSVYREIGSGTYRLRVTASGDANDVRLDLQNVVLGSQEVSTLVLSSTRGGVLVNGLQLVQRGAATAQKNAHVRVRVAGGAIPNGRSVTAVLSGATLTTTSPGVSNYKLVPAGALAIDVKVGGTAASVPAYTATAGDDLTLIVLGTQAAAEGHWVSDDNTPAIVATNARLRVANALTNLAGTLTLTVDSSSVADGVAAGEASALVNLAANTSTTPYQVEVTSPGLVTPLVAASDRVLAAGKVYTLFVLGDAAGTPTAVLRASR